MPRILKSIKFEAGTTVAIQTEESPPEAESPFVSEDTTAASPEPVAAPEETQAEKDARTQIQLILDQASQQVESWKEEARKTGWQVGYEEGRRAAETELRDAVQCAGKVAESALGAKKKFLHGIEGEIGRLSVAIARKIMGRELTLDPEAVADVVARVIEESDVRQGCTIRVHPADHAILEPHWQAMAKLQQPDRTWDLVADKRVDRGGCVISVGGGTVDGQLNMQLAQVEKAFVGPGQ